MNKKAISDQQRINPGHPKARQVLRIVGPILLAVGGLLMAIGIGNFFWSFGSMQMPRYFWCAFAGGPLLFLGLAMTSWGYMGAIARYQAGEVAPVGKDTFNYMADGTREGVQTFATAVGQGFSQGFQGGGAGPITCSSCQTPNDPDAQFCDSCGSAMKNPCPACRTVNDPDARFCDNCGSALQA